MPVSIDEFESGELPSVPSVPEQVLTFLAGRDDQAFRRAEIATAIDENPNAVGTALSRLKDRDLVRNRGEYWAITDVRERVIDAYDLHIASERLDDADGGTPSERTG